MTRVDVLSRVSRLLSRRFFALVPIPEQGSRKVVPFPLFSVGGTGTLPPCDQYRPCHPADVRRTRPDRSSDSSTSPRRWFLMAKPSRTIARERQAVGQHVQRCSRSNRTAQSFKMRFVAVVDGNSRSHADDRAAEDPSLWGREFL
jgi:hypothetical protein